MQQSENSAVGNLEPLYSEAEIRTRLTDLAKRLITDYPDHMYFVCILKGATTFHADLIREINRQGGPMIYSEYFRASSYKDDSSSGEVNLYGELDLKGKDTIILEDIVDTGRTVTKLKAEFLGAGANSVKVCTLLDKKGGRKIPVVPEYSAFPDTPDKFIVGYGLDFNQKYRELPYIAILHLNK